jgi:hypothetical protein
VLFTGILRVGFFRYLHLGSMAPVLCNSCAS